MLPSPNIWNWPDVYARENRAQDADGALWRALAERVDWTGANVVDVGCGGEKPMITGADIASSCPAVVVPDWELP